MPDFPAFVYPYWQTASVANAHIQNSCHIWNKRLLNLRLRSTPLDPVLILSLSWSCQLMHIPERHPLVYCTRRSSMSRFKGLVWAVEDHWRAGTQLQGRSYS
ncbi:hypothetical protein CNYM01_06438 [Colletotrichum nymphaeae SA-01]|uniref:Uncharacterized protein n=1 Tax=Colletotrichum nymphaeae SA-01 TaxID=1460502 RepID=A0A135SBW9_9PEZI|nr:hypothetical protein CNYM01_06438 [Colletotrichum nymphaeae SA-01]